MDKKVLQSLNDGPMGPQGPVKVNYTPQNREANFQPVFKIYSHEYPTETEETIESGGDQMIVDDNSIEDPGEDIIDGDDPIDDDI